MANFKTQQSNDYPATGENKIVDHDPMIVKVPMDNVDFGSRKGTMTRAKNAEHYGEQKMGIKHVEGKTGGA